MPVFTDLSPKQQGQSLGDIVNLARGVQAYQQANAINPLLVREQTAKTNVAEQTAPEQITQAKQTSEKGRQDIAKTNLVKFQDIVGAFATDKRLLDAVEKNDVQGAQRLLSQGVQQLINAGFDAPEIYKGAAQLMESTKTDLKSLPEQLRTLNKQAVGAESRLSQQTPQASTFGGQPAGFLPGTSQVVPLQFPQTQAQPQGQVQGQAQPQTTMQLPYPVRQAGMPFAAAPSEESDRAKGQAYRQIVQAKQTEYPTMKRNLDEVIKVATELDPNSIWSAGALGAIKRKFSDFVGDPIYRQLSKDLANVAISNIQAIGGSMDTVAGQQLTRMANGDETYPPEVLLNIARRTYSDLTNLNMQAQGAQTFASKYGDNNLAAFRNAWNKNADSKVFEAISIYENVQDPAQRKKLIDELLGSNQKVREEFANKYKNIKKLTETGEL